MGKLFASIGAFLGTIVALTSTGACYFYMFDEAEMPESLLR